MSLKIEIDTLHHGDCLSVMPNIEAKSINMVCVDLPYGEIQAEWDTKIDLSKMWTELKRIGTDNCIYAFFCSTRFGVEIINSNPTWYAYDIVWKKTNAVGFLNVKVCPLRAHEMIYIFKKKNKPKGCKSVYNPQKTEGVPYTRSFTGDNPECVKKNGEANIYRTTNKNLNNIRNNTSRFPISVIEFKKKRETGHMTEKPLGLCEWLVKTYSNEGDTVLDFCMGSGTTCVACVNTRRHYIGIEMDKKWYDNSVERVRGTPAPPANLPTPDENVVIVVSDEEEAEE